jgi:transposase
MEIKLHVTEYQLEKGRCARCHANHIAGLPEGVTWGMTGPRLTSFMSNLVSHYQLSRRELQAFLKEHYHFSLSLGTIFNKQKIVNAALEAPTEALLPAIKESLNMNTDETGHKRDGKKQWLWCFATTLMAYFCITKSRGKKVLISLIGDYEHVLTSDRYHAYNYFDSANRQLCWAHMKRDFTKVSEKKDKLCARIGQKLLLCKKKLFENWHAFKASRITRDELLRQTEPIRRQVGELLKQGSYTDPSFKVSRFCN